VAFELRALQRQTKQRELQIIDKLDAGEFERVTEVVLVSKLP
jgi:hypothetical protein